MPELPEVETIRRVIEPQIQGRRIVKVEAVRPEVIAHPDAGTFCERLTGQAVLGMARRGKFLIFLLENDSRLILHLRMTGCLLLTPAGYPEKKYTHAVFHLDNGDALRFSDMRRFGRFWLLQEGEADIDSGINRLGPEPFDGGLTASYLQQHFGKRKKAIKECLMEQDVVAGIGNIYSDEILFACAIHPARPASSLGAREWERLAAAIPERLAYFIEKNNMTPQEYLQSGGQDYRNTPFLQAYGRKGEACPRCGDTLCRLSIGGRSSIYCPSCQRDEKGDGRTETL